MHRFYRFMFVVALGVILGSAAAARAENSLRLGEGGVTAEIVHSQATNHTAVSSPDFVLSGRYFVQDNLAATARFGFQHVSEDRGNDTNSGTNFRVGVGLRWYIARTDLAPMMGLDVDYVSEFDPCGRINSFGRCKGHDNTGFDLDGYVGMEYFFTKRASIEGRVGLLVQDRSDTNTTIFQTFTSDVAVTLYIP